MNTQKGFAPLLLILLAFVVIGGGVYLYVLNNAEESTQNTPGFSLGGVWEFWEASKEPNVNGTTVPVWQYILSIDPTDDSRGTLLVDGYQTSTNLNVRINKLNDSANVVFESYGPDNQFETYKKGDVLLSISPDSEGRLMIDWYKMQPNLEESKAGAVFERGAGVAVNKNTVKENNKSVTTTSDAKVTLAISGNNLMVIQEGKTIQTLTLSDDALSVLSMENPYINEKRFLTNYDVNFDGHKDAALLTGVGYGGVNTLYDYYIFNPISSRLEKSDTLLQVSNPSIDISAKKIISSYRSGPLWYSQTFQWNGSTHVISDAVSM